MRAKQGPSPGGGGKTSFLTYPNKLSRGNPNGSPKCFPSIYSPPPDLLLRGFGPTKPRGSVWRRGREHTKGEAGVHAAVDDGGGGDGLGPPLHSLRALAARRPSCACATHARIDNSSSLPPPKLHSVKPDRWMERGESTSTRSGNPTKGYARPLWNASDSENIQHRFVCTGISQWGNCGILNRFWNVCERRRHL